jgi:hypothetical protein
MVVVTTPIVGRQIAGQGYKVVPLGLRHCGYPLAPALAFHGRIVGPILEGVQRKARLTWVDRGESRRFARSYAPSAPTALVNSYTRLRTSASSTL